MLNAIGEAKQGTFADLSFEHEKGDDELQAERAEDGARIDGSFVARRNKANRQKRSDTDDANEFFHPNPLICFHSV